MRAHRREASWYRLALVVLTVAGAFLIQYLTEPGIGMVNDSVGYVAGARNLLAGQGYSRLTGDHTAVPISNFPPMTSIMLAAATSTGADIFATAQVLNGLFFAATILLSAALARRASGNDLLSLLAAVFVLISAPIFGRFTVLMSEPLYLTLSLLVLLLILHWADSGKSGLILLAGLLTSFTILTRYAGAALFGAASIFILSNARFAIKRRLSNLMLYGLFSALPVAAWLLRNMRYSDNAANRQVAYHPIPIEKINAGLANFFGWLLPERGGLLEKLAPFYPVIFTILLAAMAVMAAVLLFRRKEKTPGQAGLKQAILLNLLYALFYIALLLLSLTFFDASSIFDDRLLTPFYIQVIILSAWLFSRLWARRPAGRLLVLAAVLVMLVSFAADARQAARDLRADGQGYANSRWTESETIDAARDLPVQTLYSNRIQALYLIGNQPAYLLPSLINPATGEKRDGFDEEIAAIREQVQQGVAMVVFFDFDDMRVDPEEGEWVSAFAQGLPVYNEANDGVIFGKR